MKRFKYSEITPEKIYKNRRSFIKSIGLGASSIAISSIPFAKDLLTKGIVDIAKELALSPIDLIKDLLFL